ncbi:hypothetical protein jhhlp_006582 [Lomentospora prolificans]|uniref:DUF4048 domain-containing protein n=1 Tax=Lomentospora prolificans TaxID=41688 RepID=A0A2N3N699_9PEZI|nr:hypothetical protein jhhlp_006582 [Lomentospora prolificans]
MARQERVRRRSSVIADRHHPLELNTSLPDNARFPEGDAKEAIFTPDSTNSSNMLRRNTFRTPPELPRSATATSFSHHPPEPMGPPTVDEILTRSSRSTSSASRNTNRLSITLPIALPTSDPSRPLPSSTTSSVVAASVPGTPARQVPTAPPTPSDANEFIIAIAAQERRVMELREELKMAEDDLKRLKRQWTMHEAYKKSNNARAPEPAKPVVPQPESWSGTPYDDDLAIKRSIELDRRKLLLQTQQNTPAGGDRKRVFQGRHARTLSLLSPTKPASDTFSVLDDADLCKSPDVERPPVVRRQSVLNKRASWQPQSYHGAATGANLHNSGPMSQIVEDFKLGFKTFYEDIRQITVGDEPVNGVVGTTRSTAIDLSGQAGSHNAANNTVGGNNRGYADDQDTIRPSTTAGRPKLAAAFDYPGDDTVETPSKPKAARPSAGLTAARDRNARARNKHFSWTPLSFDGIDGEAWLNFDSPSSTGKSTRWSGSTMNDEENASVQSTSVKAQEIESPLTKKANTLGLVSPVSINHQRLEELTAQVVNRLSPSNIKRTATDYLTQWEQSLGEAAVENHPKNSTPAAEPKEDKENLLVQEV